MKPLPLLLALALTGCTVQVVPPQAPGPVDAPVEPQQGVVVAPNAESSPSLPPVPGVVAPVPPSPPSPPNSPMPARPPNASFPPITAPSLEVREQATVEVYTGRFSPPSLVVKAGGPVTFVNKDQATHELSGDVQATLKPGGTVEKRFAINGGYVVTCRTHPNDVLRIEVVGGQTPTTGVTPPVPTPLPSSGGAPLPIATPNSWSPGAFEPADGATLSSMPIVMFRMPPIEGATRYRLNLYAGFTPYVGAPVSVTDSDIPVVHHPALPAGPYIYQLTATRANGATAVSNWIRFTVRSAQ